MSCRNRYTNVCPKNPFTQTCNENIEKTCEAFVPFPPRMTDEEFAKKQAEELKDIPKELHGALSFYAWQEGHASGYEEVISHLSDLVANLCEPLKELEKRVKKDCIGS